MTDDISHTLAPKSDQLDAIDLMGKPPQVFTVTKVDVKQNPDAEQPVSIHLAEFPRVWRPGVNQRRVLGYCWGNKSAGWTGHQVELYCDESVKFGNDTTGGTRISRLSHIAGPQTVPLLLSKGRSGVYKVQPLPDVAAMLSVEKLRAEWKTADPERRKVIEAEVAALESRPDAPTPADAEPEAVQP